MRAVVEYAVRHRVTVLMISAAAVIFGLVSLGRLPLQLLPDLSYPSLTVQTEYADSAPSEVENLITRPLEEGVGVIPGLRRIHSVSEAGLSEIRLEFGWNTDMDFAALDVREKIDLVTLPEGTRSPVLLRFDPAQDPVVLLGLWGGENQVLLRHLAEQVLKKELESLPGIAAAKVIGGHTEEIHVDVDEHRLAALGIPITAVAEVVGAENVNASGGRLRDRDAQYLVRTLNQYTGPEDVAETIIYRKEGRVVRLGDVARVTRAPKEREIVSRIDGKPAVEVAIYKEGDANIVEVARRIHERVPELSKMLPSGIEARILSDQSSFIQSAVRQVQSSAVMGGILAVLVLLLFLRDVKATFIIAVAIPLSIVTTFVLMYRQGITLNVMSLGGLALGIGMLVDNSIVVLESIVRHHRQGRKSLVDSVIDGTVEVGVAISASTFTAVAVFIPILFVEGVARQIFQDQALTVTYSLLVSLAVAVTVTPMLAALGKNRRAALPAAGAHHENAEFADHGRIFTRVRTGYRSLLQWALARRVPVVAGTIALFALSVVGLRVLGSDLIPSFVPGELRFDLEYPEGTPIEHTDRLVAALENDLRGIDGVRTIHTNVGLDARQSGTVRSKKEHHAELNLLLERGLRQAEEERILETVRSRFRESPHMTGTLLRPTAFTFKTPVEVEIYGYRLDDLAIAAGQVADALATVPDLQDIAVSLETGSPEVEIRFDRDKLKMAGLGLRDASESLRTMILGRVATDYKERDRQIDVLVRSGDAQSVSLDALETMVVGYREGTPVQLAAVADLSVHEGPARIQRIAQSRAVTVSANLAGRNLGAVTADLRTALAVLPLPPNVTVQMAGQNEEMDQSLRSLLFAALLAVFLVYIVMASQFESLLSPFLILLSVPMALIGVVAALWITGTPVSVVVMIGGIMLAGISVNNGIVLVDLVNQLRREGRSVTEALLEAGEVRLRPILMNTTANLLGLVPLAMGAEQGGEIMAPLGITVIGGLLSSTVLTLIVIPVLYRMVHRR